MRIYVDGDIQFDSGTINTTNIWTSGQWQTLYWQLIGYSDDYYWGDTTGAAPQNAFMGDCHVQGQVALTDADSSGGGTYKEWTPLTGTDHGAMVDEIPPDDGATYVWGSDVGLRETFKFPSIIPTVGTIYGVQLMPNALKTDAGPKEIANLVLSGSLEVGDTQALATTNYRYYPQTYQRNPATSAVWSVSTVNAMQGGLKIIT